MVLYHDDGRVVIAHEEYLERAANTAATERPHPYTDQVEVYKQRNRPASTNDVQIVIEVQHYRTLYCERAFGWGSDFEWIKGFRERESTDILPRVCRATLILCSSHARDHFTYNPDSDQLCLPVTYPRVYEADQSDEQMAYIRAEEIEDYIIPWLEKVREYMGSLKSKKSTDGDDEGTSNKTRNQEMRDQLAEPDGPLAIEIPESLIEKIHLYNAMLQFGLPKFVQLPLIDALVLQMYQSDLSACHLDVLEITVGRFYSRGLAILDPVINHLVGTYARRTLYDRRNPERGSSRKRKRKAKKPAASGKSRPRGLVRADGTPETRFEEELNRAVRFKNTKRKCLEFTNQRVRRGPLGRDTYVLPPKLPVLGHCIEHWSGVRADRTPAPRDMGLPLNVRLHRKFIRTDGSRTVGEDDCEEVQMNRLVGQEYCQRHRPGQAGIYGSDSE